MALISPVSRIGIFLCCIPASVRFCPLPQVRVVHRDMIPVSGGISLCENPEGFFKGLQNATHDSTEINVGYKMGKNHQFPAAGVLQMSLKS